MINARLRTDTPSDAPLSDGVSFVGEFFTDYTHSKTE